jgi:eukaryotic-like serine/threonine-protein kinase
VLVNVRSLAQTPMGKTWQVGDQIEGRWEVYKILQGGAGIVYVVYDHAFREPFAAKTFRDEAAAQSPVIADRFLREGLAWVQLGLHPNVTQARMVEKIGGKPFLFLEYVSGGDLGSWIGTPRLTEDLPRILSFAIQFCDGMIHLQSKNVRVHRDIKPRNCLIAADGVLKITDFGLAKLSSEEIGYGAAGPIGGVRDQALTAAAIGTCTHMAPEQFDNSSKVDARADVYAFGVMLYQMVQGELPFVGDSWQELEHLHKHQQPPHLKKALPLLDELVQTCLAKDPTRRIAGFTQLRSALGEIFTGVVGTPPPEPLKDSVLTAAQWNNKGSSLDNLGRRDEAIQCYDMALHLNPQLAPAWLNKGVTLFAARQPQEALDCYEQGLRVDPKSEQLWSNKGVALKSLGKTAQALECYERALRLNPRHSNAWVNKGVAFKAQGETQKALECYDRALELNRSDPNAWTNKGNVLYGLGRYAEALAAYDGALALDSNLGLTWLNKGMALSALARHEEALHCYGTAIEISPQLEQAWFLRAATMVQAFHQYREAIPYLEEAERLGVKEAKEILAACRSVVVGGSGS